MGIMKLWLKLTDISSTSLGEKIDELIFVVIGAVLLLVLGGRFLNVLTTPFLNSVDEEVKNSQQKPTQRVCCDNCLHYDWTKHKCGLTSKEVKDAGHRVCSLFNHRHG